jgi:hypothetical protein
MALLLRDLNVRSPRHEALPAAEVQVEIERPLYDGLLVKGCELMNLSRSGCQLRAAEPLRPSERVVVRLALKPQQPLFEITAVVRWQSHDEALGTWHIGCQFDKELGWEALGELFLENILSVDSAR